MSAKKISFNNIIISFIKAIYTVDESQGITSYENMRYRFILKQSNLKNYLLFLVLAGITAAGSLFFPFLPILLLGTAFAVNNFLKAYNKRNPKSALFNQGLFLGIALTGIVTLSILFPPFALLITTLGAAFYATATNFKSIKANNTNLITFAALVLSLISIAVVLLLPTVFSFIPAALLPFIPLMGVLIISCILTGYAAYQLKEAKQNYLKEQKHSSSYDNMIRQSMNAPRTSRPGSDEKIFDLKDDEEIDVEEDMSRSRSSSIISFFSTNDFPEDYDNKSEEGNDSPTTTNESLSDDEPIPVSNKRKNASLSDDEPIHLSNKRKR